METPLCEVKQEELIIRPAQIVDDLKIVNLLKKLKYLAGGQNEALGQSPYFQGVRAIRSFRKTL